MSSPVHGLPIYLLTPAAKPQVIAWINARGLPSRFARYLLQEWGSYTGVIITPSDYAQVGTVGHT